MLFRLCYESTSTANRLDLSNSLEFKLPGEPSLQIKVRKPKTDNSDRALSTEAEQVVAGSAIIEAIADFPISEEHKAYLTSLGERTVYPDCNNGALGYRDESGNIADFPKLNSLPLGLQECLREEVYSKLADAAKKFIKTLRWRLDIPGEHHSLKSECMRFSVDSIQWNPVPTGGPSLTLQEIYVAKRLDEEACNQLVPFWVGGGEPFYHELFREAWEQRRNNPRSAILIGIAAAESALKQCIAKLVPDAEWLMQELQSPPIDKIMKDYFPRLLKNNNLNNIAVIPEVICTEIKTGVVVRNKISHTGEIPEKVSDGGLNKKLQPYRDNLPQKTEELLFNILDLLWLLDYYGGHEWALHHVREEILVAKDIKGIGKKKNLEITEEGFQEVRIILRLEDKNDISGSNV
jgi:hypothetical protein